MKHHILNLTSGRWFNRHLRGCNPGLAAYRFLKPQPEPSLQKTEHGSFVPWWQVSERGAAQATSGWNHRHRVLDCTFQKQTTSDTFSGAGILRAAKRDSRFVTMFSTIADTKLKNLIQLAKDELSMARIGVSGPKWARLRFRSQFYNARPNGWSMRGLVNWSYGRFFCTELFPDHPHVGAKNWPATLFSAGH
jgi:hypothetical protein